MKKGYGVFLLALDFREIMANLIFQHDFSLMIKKNCE